MRLRQQPHLSTSLSSIQDHMASASSFPYCDDRSYVDTNCKNNDKNNNNNSNNNNSNRMINDCSGRRSPSVVGSHPSTSKLISSSVHPMTNIRGENCHDGENLRLLLFFIFDCLLVCLVSSSVYFLLSPSVIFLLSSFLCHLLPSSSVIFLPSVLRRISRFPDLLISPKQGPRSPPCSAVGENAESSRGGSPEQRRFRGKPALNLSNRGKWGPATQFRPQSTKRVGT